MIRLILARHGNTFKEGEVPVQIGARTNLPLTPYGKVQAEQLASYLLENKIEPRAIYAGDLLRQTESATIVGNHFKKGYLYEPALNEIDYGLWEGLSAEEITSRWPEEFAEWNGEGKWQEKIFAASFQKHKESMEKWFVTLRSAYSSGYSIVGITSNGLLRSFHSEKVKTGHFCELHLFQDSLKIEKWNVNPAC